ncbi:hypothetical protein ACFVH6_01040 [Spirillospora sp. NPDC127200]
MWAGDSPVTRQRADPLTLLAAVAARTERVAVGTAVLLPALDLGGGQAGRRGRLAAVPAHAGALRRAEGVGRPRHHARPLRDGLRGRRPRTRPAAPARQHRALLQRSA